MQSKRDTRRFLRCSAGALDAAIKSGAIPAIRMSPNVTLISSKVIRAILDGSSAFDEKDAA